MPRFWRAKSTRGSRNRKAPSDPYAPRPAVSSERRPGAENRIVAACWQMSRVDDAVDDPFPRSIAIRTRLRSCEDCGLRILRVPWSVRRIFRELKNLDQFILRKHTLAGISQLEHLVGGRKHGATLSYVRHGDDAIFRCGRITLPVLSNTLSSARQAGIGRNRSGKFGMLAGRSRAPCCSGQLLTHAVFGDKHLQ